MPLSTYIELPEELFEGSGSSAYSGVLQLDQLRVGPDTYVFQEELPWNVVVIGAGEGQFMVSGSIEGLATTDCARCLEPFQIDLDGEVEGFIFVTDPGDDLPEEMDEDEFVVMDEHHGADIRTFLEAALVLDAPRVPIHDDDCKGLCPQCGANLNEGPCGCTNEPDSDFEANKNPFAALKDFKFDN